MSLTVSANEQPLHKHKPAFFISQLNLYSILPYRSPFLCPAEVELSCLIDSISTTTPRIEWKKITNDGPSYVYFEKKISGNV